VSLLFMCCRNSNGDDAVGPSRASSRGHRAGGHKTCVVVRGNKRQISCGNDKDREMEREMDKAEVALSVSVDGECVLHLWQPSMPARTATVSQLLHARRPWRFFWRLGTKEEV
jgi:hypothetical protein